MTSAAGSPHAEAAAGERRMKVPKKITAGVAAEHAGILHESLYQAAMIMNACGHLQSHCDGEDVEEQVEVLREVSREKFGDANHCAVVLQRYFELSKPKKPVPKKAAVNQEKKTA
jgi:hypothetical protein